MGAPFDAVFFDLDGTLLDTGGHIVESLRFSLVHHLDYAPSDAVLVSGIGTPLYEQVAFHGAVALGHRPDAALVEALAQTYIEHNLSTHDERVTAFPEALETLEALRGRGVELAIITSKPNATARRGLRVTGLDDFFPLVVGFDDVSVPKPDPTPVRHTLKALGLSAERTIFVGDSPHDVHSGNGAGVATGAAGWGPFDAATLQAANPTYWLDSLLQLLTLVR